MMGMHFSERCLPSRRKYAMKLFSLLLLLSIESITAFAPVSSPNHATSTQLNLFGGGAKKDGEKKGPGMFDQLAMLKKAQEMAQKKNKLDQELAAMDFKGSSSDGKVHATYKYVPSKNPMDPTPEYDPISFDFDEEWLASASPEDVSAAAKEAIVNAVIAINKGMEEKYQVLTGDIAETFQALKSEGSS